MKKIQCIQQKKRVRVVLQHKKSIQKACAGDTTEVGSSTTTTKCHVFVREFGRCGLMSKYWGHVVVHHFPEVVKNSTQWVTWYTCSLSAHFDPQKKIKNKFTFDEMHTYIELRSVGIDRAIYIYICGSRPKERNCHRWMCK